MRKTLVAVATLAILAIAVPASADNGLAYHSLKGGPCTITRVEEGLSVSCDNPTGVRLIFRVTGEAEITGTGDFHVRQDLDNRRYPRVIVRVRPGQSAVISSVTG